MVFALFAWVVCDGPLRSDLVLGLEVLAAAAGGGGALGGVLRVGLHQLRVWGLWDGHAHRDGTPLLGGSGRDTGKESEGGKTRE